MVINPKNVSRNILESVRLELNGKSPSLEILRVGDDIGAVSYEKSIMNTLKNLGFRIHSTVFDKETSEEEFLQQLNELNSDKEVDGILVLNPLPSSYNENKIRNLILPDKDPDGMTPTNLGLLMDNDESGLYPCTAQAVLEILDYYKIPVKGKDIVIINNSDSVGKPLSLLLTNRFATVTLCHVFTENLKKYTKDADIIITAAGHYGLITPDMIKDSVTLIDIAVTVMKDENGKPILKEGKPVRCGDILESCRDKAENVLSLSPGCGGGTGSVTTAVLAKNLIKAYKKKI